MPVLQAVEHLASNDKAVQAVHHFRDRSGNDPPADIKQVDVCCLELLQRYFSRELYTLGPVANKV
ncbi:hypothetical protein BT96DRAFT_397946 [Gymnopus androsaceus JB14]|uniref:Uncharacterized protein n=1 Tax=Gymnopus androsaceus JB14 TaxID=1447944 RepID=A0A6A4I2B4_9AGAR|nr:hypothetical protein BT96DRAFT_397946 [Gymnopus androsaceus JB14]